MAGVEAAETHRDLGKTHGRMQVGTAPCERRQNRRWRFALGNVNIDRGIQHDRPDKGIVTDIRQILAGAPDEALGAFVGFDAPDQGIDASR